MWVIRGVEQYRSATNRSCVVLNAYTEKPRYFETRDAATQYAHLSGWRNVKIEDDDAL